MVTINVETQVKYANIINNSYSIETDFVDSYRYVGQNIAMRMYSKNYVIETTDVTISSFIDLWFNEYVNCSMSYINNFEDNK